MEDICFSAAFCFSTSCGMGLDGDGFWRASMGSAVACVTVFSGENLGIDYALGIVPSC